MEISFRCSLCVGCSETFSAQGLAHSKGSIDNSSSFSFAYSPPSSSNSIRLLFLLLQLHCHLVHLSVHFHKNSELHTLIIPI